MLEKRYPKRPLAVLKRCLTIILLLSIIVFISVRVTLTPISPNLTYSLPGYLTRPWNLTQRFNQPKTQPERRPVRINVTKMFSSSKIETYQTSTVADSSSSTGVQGDYSETTNKDVLKPKDIALNGENSPVVNGKEGPLKKNYKEITKPSKYNPVDLMKQGPFDFLPNYKNPCWLPAEANMSESAINCLPYFYLIGAPKSGTTDLFVRLKQHPEISNFLTKEPHWIARKCYYAKNRVRNDLSSYLNYFRPASREIFMKKDKSGNHRIIIGDLSASTMWDNDYWTILPQNKNLTEPRYTNADYIYHLNPNTRILASIRHPVNRLYSDYLYFNKNASAETFHAETVKIIQNFNRCMNNGTLRHCIYKPQVSVVRLRIGVYHVHLKEYFRVFPREHILVLKLEQFSKNTTESMKQVFSFLGLASVEKSQLRKIADPDKHANTRTKKAQKVGDMLPQTRTLLEDFYRPHNEELVKLLGSDFDYNR